MENPATWGPAEKIIHDVLNQRVNILPEFHCGLSLERHITDALREHGLLKEEGNAGKESQEEENSRTRPYPPHQEA